MPRKKDIAPGSFLKRLVKSKLAIIFEVVILVVLTSALAKEVVREYQIQSEIDGLRENVAQLENKNFELNGLLSYFQSDSFKEEQARLKLGLQKPGESVVAVLGESTEFESTEIHLAESTRLANQENLPNPTRWWNYFTQPK